MDIFTSLSILELDGVYVRPVSVCYTNYFKKVKKFSKKVIAVNVKKKFELSRI
jgi:hypothetical protein